VDFLRKRDYPLGVLSQIYLYQINYQFVCCCCCNKQRNKNKMHRYILIC